MCANQDPLAVYRNVLNQQAFGPLEEMEAPSRWEGLSDAERQALAMLFVWRGERAPVEGKEGVKESLLLSEQLAPRSAVPLYWQAIAWLKGGVLAGSSDLIGRACEKFSEGVDIEPEQRQG